MGKLKVQHNLGDILDALGVSLPADSGLRRSDTIKLTSSGDIEALKIQRRVPCVDIEQLGLDREETVRVVPVRSVIEQRVVSCRIIDPDNNRGKYEVWVTYDHDIVEGAESLVFNYYSDELSFSDREFIGLTEQECIDLFTKKDIAYVQGN